MTEIKDGVYFDMPEEYYFSLPCLTNSGIKDLNINPLDFWGKRHGWTEQKETKSTDFGSMAHKLLLEGEEAFHAKYVIKPDGMSFSTKAGKEFKAQYEFAEFVKERDYQTVMRLKKVVDHVPNYKKYFDNGNPEVVLIWTETVNDMEVKCAARCDWLGDQGITDLKTFANIRNSPISEAVSTAFWQNKYFTQGHWYLRGLKALKLDKYPLKFMFFFVQSDGIPNIMPREYASHNNGMQTAYDRLAQIHCDRALNIYSRCMKKYGWDKPWFTENSERPFDEGEVPNFVYDKEN